MSGPRTTLFTALRRTNLRSTLLAVLVAGVALTVVTFVTLRSQQHANLDLVARTLAYSTEAATLFADAATATEILTQIAEREHLVSATLVTRDGRTLAHYAARPQTPGERFGALAGRLVFPQQTRADITHDRQTLGEITLRGDGSVFVGFFLKVFAVVLASLALAMFAARRMARRMEQHIVRQLDTLASFAHATRLNQAFERRLPAFDVIEFDELGQDFNALFGEIEARNAELLARQNNLEQANASLSHLALHDSLTGLANRARFDARLRHALDEARRSGGQLGLLYLDNDRFKSINDRYGHAAGDALLVEVAQRIRGAIRDSDLVARLGGDEFTVLLAPLREPADAAHVADKILAAMAEPLVLTPETTIVPGVSIGIAIFPDHAASAEQLLRAADHALYRAKHAGRGTWRTHEPALDTPQQP